MAHKKSKNCAFSYGVSPGSSKLIPVSVDKEKLLCLPEPLIPSNGFSFNKATQSLVMKKPERQVNTPIRTI